jgi:hypothetical protein
MPERDDVIDRREAVRRVSAMLGGIALIGGSGLLTACERAQERAGDTTAAARAGNGVGEFTPQDIALLDEIAETMLPQTSTPGAKAAHVGAFMALMVTDGYDERDRKIFRDGLRQLDEASNKASSTTFLSATPQQRLALLETLDRDQKRYMDALDAARKEKKSAASRGTTAAAPKQDSATPPEGKKGDAFLPDQRKEGAIGPSGGAPAITGDSPPHYFRMMKELALLGYFTSEIGYTQAMRYVESPGRFDPCAPYAAGEKAWAPHA